ncbi:MAG: prepilin-type N-terminal cleavage/methylation domain-containing protein [Clostridiales bacterium]|nr:prepilin-type N-terminal cleavage/methylation domain-containing protein [Clostridiales bacterium]
MRKNSFTLAEILVAMAIIGVVAALTVPSLSEAYRKRVLTTQLQRAYAEVSQAAGLVMSNEMPDDFKLSKAVKNKDFLGKYLTVSKKGQWGGASQYGFFYDKYATYDLFNNEMGSKYHNWNNFDCGVTKSGAAICIDKYGIGILDVNGENGPNLIGRDAFQITFKPNGQVIGNNSDYRPLESIIEGNWDIDSPNWEWTWR